MFTKTNSTMQKLLDTINIEASKKIEFSLNHFQELLFPQFKAIYDCVIISDYDGPTKPIAEFYDAVEKMYTDKTGYEAANTETLLNHYIKTENMADLIYLAFVVVDVWALQLKAVAPENEFCYILFCDVEMGYVTLRFHKVREKEDLWISENLEEYDQPIGYRIP